MLTPSFLQPERPRREPQLGGFGGLRGGGTVATARAAIATTTARTVVLLSLLLFELGFGHVALVDPDLDADTAVRGLGLEEAVIDEGAEGLQRNAALTVELGTAHFRTAEAAGELDADTLGTGAHGVLLGLTHGTTEGDAVGQLLSDALSDELGVQRGVLDFEDVELDLLAGQLLELGADALSLGATTTDHDARTGGVNVDANAVAGALDDDAGHASALEVLAHLLADLIILKHEVAVAFAGLVGVGEPLGAVVLSDAQTVAKRIDLLTHL